MAATGSGLVVCLILAAAAAASCRSQQLPGTWEVLVENAGIASMHTAVTHYGDVVLLDRTDIGPSRRRLPRSRCRVDPSDSLLPRLDCYAHSILFNPATRSIRSLKIQTDTWCSSGQFLPDGTLLQTGGSADGFKKFRAFTPCPSGHPLHLCDWQELDDLQLSSGRWYATNQILPDGSVIIVGGRGSNSVEFYPPRHDNPRPFPFLADAEDTQMDNLYPYLHLLPDGNLFVFANRDSILLDYKQHRVVRTFPRMPGGGSRSYPSTASSVMLPLDHADGFRAVEVMVCGGGASGAYRAARRRRFREALSSCGRMVVTAAEPRWEMEDMPGQRLMSDMLLLPTGDVLLVNGATRGCAGWGRARGAARRPYLYQPGGAPGQRFSVLRPSGIARMYHSSAVVLPDGRVLVAGSNPNRRYVVSGDGVRYPTELRVEAFSPPYMQAGAFSDRRASNLSLIGVSGDSEVKYGEDFGVRLQFGRRWEGEALGFHVYAPPFATHSTSMNQRLLKLRCKSIVREEDDGSVSAVVVAPPSPNVAPSGYYLLTVVNGGIPSQGIWVRFVHE
uniref:Galactose oxidase n=1 Tax=Anthurium amnicola TaxID=1678845 RepID=A0A1D1XRX2_9ARAE